MLVSKTRLGLKAGDWEGRAVYTWGKSGISLKPTNEKDYILQCGTVLSGNWGCNHLLVRFSGYTFKATGVMLEKRQGVKTSKHSSDKILHMEKNKHLKWPNKEKSILHHIWFSFFQLIDALTWWETKKKKERCNIKSVPLSLLEQDWDIWTALTPTSKKKHLRFQTEVGGCELLLSWWCGGLRSWCPTSQNFRLSVLGRSGGGGYTCSQCTIIVPPHLSFLMLRRVVSRLFFFPCLAPSLPGAVICLWGDRASKHWVLWSFPPPVVLVRCKQTRPGTSLPRRIPGDPAGPTYRGDRPLQVFPEVLSLRAYRPEPLHRYQGGLQSDRV